jgi:hypothetical protein
MKIAVASEGEEVSMHCTNIIIKEGRLQQLRITVQNGIILIDGLQMLLNIQKVKKITTLTEIHHSNKSPHL